MNQLQTGKTPLAATPGRKNPDVVVIHTNQTALFKTENRRASEWLCKHYRMSLKIADDKTVIQAHPSRCKRIIEELKAAGFIVLAQVAPTEETPH